MKQTIHVHIGSQAFTFDTDAYNTLKSYLDDISGRLSPDERTETLNDIEIRLAELFREMTGNNPIRVITLDHVRRVASDHLLRLCLYPLRLLHVPYLEDDPRERCLMMNHYKSIQRLDMVLFHVEGRKIRLTPEGEVLVREGKKLLHQREEMMAAMNSVNETGCGLLRLAVPVGRGSHIIPTCIPPFHWRFPKAEIRLTEGHSKELVNQVQAGACDLVIINKPSFPIHLEYETLGYEKMMLVVGSDTPWADSVRYDRDGQDKLFLILRDVYGSRVMGYAGV